MKDGTYSHCSQCKLKNNYCNDFDKNIDNIMLTKEEYDIIIDRVGKNYDRYFKLINKDVCHLLNIDGICPFYLNDWCCIYDIRPADCRLFPYDIKEINNDYYLIQYDLPCGSNNVSEIPLDTINTLLTIIETYTAKENEKLVNNLSYKIIKKI